VSVVICPRADRYKGTLVHFQGAKFDEKEIKRVVKMINSESGEHSLELNVLDRVFEMWWPKLELDVHKMQKPAKAKGEKRTDRDILEEVLSLVRAPAKITAQPGDQHIPRATVEFFGP
jgi:pyruvate-formate lyase-activating enzyme